MQAPLSIDDAPVECSDKSGLRGRQRVARNEAILEAAFALIAEKGYLALTMDDLAERVGISRQTLYHHFPNKDAIALRAILTIMRRGIDSIRSIDPALPPRVRLETVIRWMIDLRFSFGLCAFANARHALMPIKAHPDYQRAFDERASAIKEIVEAAQDSGALTQGVPSAVIVQILLGMLVDAHYEGVVMSGVATPASIGDGIVQVFFAGFGAGSEAGDACD